MNLIDIHTSRNKTGSISNIELDNDLPFTCKNVFYVYNIDKNVIHGNHAHKRCKEAIIVLNGKCKFILDDCISENAYIIGSPQKCLIVQAGTWLTYEPLTDNCLLLVCASETYADDEYIRDYIEFKQWKNRQ